MEKEPRSVLSELNFLMGQNTSEMGLTWGLCAIAVSLAERAKQLWGKMLQFGGNTHSSFP